jgi:peptidyl-dipeptidase A
MPRGGIDYIGRNKIFGGVMKKAGIIILMAMLGGILFGNMAFGEGNGEEDLRAFIKDYEQKIIPLSKENNLWSFKASISGKDEDYEKSAQLSIEMEKIYSDTVAFAKLKAIREAGKVTDPLLYRQMEQLYLSYLGSQIDMKTLEELIRRSTEISQKFYTYRTKVGERVLSDNQVDSILKYSTNSAELEETWKSSKQIGAQLASEIIELVKLRNQGARSLGFANYYEMQLKLSEEEPSEIAALFDQLDSLTRDKYKPFKDQIDSALAVRYNIKRSELQPWHYQNRFFQEAPSLYPVDLDAYYRDKDPVGLAAGYFAGIGMPVESILVRSDLYEKPGKYQHAYSTDIDRAGDVRIVCNVRPDCGWTGTMLHELGHAVYDYYGDRQLPWLLRGSASSFTTEAIANFFGRLAGSPAWLKNVVGVPQVEIAKVADDCVKTQRLVQLVFSRWSQVMVRFERALYENPDQDLNKLWWQLVKKYQGVRCPAGRNEADWASKIHLIDAPVYYHNYLMGELLASQLTETLGNQVLHITDPGSADFAGDLRIGKFFEEKVFRPGSRYPWNEMIERATGEKLTSVYYVRQFID